MIRDVTGERLGILRAGRCPVCACDQWQPGPAGGASQNWECAGCHRRFNLTFYDGQLVWAQAIGQRPLVDDWRRYRMAHCVQRLPVDFSPEPSPEGVHA